MKRQTSWCSRGLAGAAAVLGLAMLPTAANAQVVISQVYGGGGNAGSVYMNDFIEVFNRGAAAVDLTGFSVQYASTAGSSWAVTPLVAFMLQPGQYYLVQEAQGAGGTTPLPTPDATGTIAMAAGSGKVALVSGIVALTGSCPSAGILDFVGYGTANCFEGAGAVSVLTNTTAAIRADGGCTDSNNNNADFAAGTPNPRNTAASTHVCTPSMPPSGSGASDPASQCPGFDVVLSVTVVQGAGPAAPISSVVADLTSIGGLSAVAMLDDGVAPDGTAGDLIYTLSATVASGTPVGNRSIPVTITDSLNRTGNASITVTVLNCNPVASASSRGVCNDETAVLTANVTPGIMPPSTGLMVFVDLSAYGAGLVNFTDDGMNGDAVANDNIFSYTFTPPTGQPSGTVAVAGGVLDGQGRNSTFSFDLSTAPCTQTDSAVVVSQIYGGGGNNGGVFRNDLVELFNRSNAPVDITGWSVQYASGSSPTGFIQKTDLAGTIPAGGYYLVQEAQGADGSQPPLPAADATGTIPMGATAGRIALVNDSVLIDLNCFAATVVDLVGYGNVFCWDGVVHAPTATNSVAEFRRDDGCFDTNNNGIDFFTATPAPRNSASPIHLCNPPPPTCPCDFNLDHLLNSQDFFDFLNCFFSADPLACGADFNASGVVNSQDFFDILNCFFSPPAGCN
jgi:hypothetical protein